MLTQDTAVTGGFEPERKSPKLDIKVPYKSRPRVMTYSLHRTVDEYSRERNLDQTHPNSVERLHLKQFTQSDCDYTNITGSPRTPRGYSSGISLKKLRRTAVSVSTELGTEARQFLRTVKLRLHNKHRKKETVVKDIHLPREDDGRWARKSSSSSRPSSSTSCYSSSKYDKDVQVVHDMADENTPDTCI